MAELVAMFRCRHCGVRMFEKDCAGHLQRHGLTVLPKDVLMHHFDKGPCDMPARPGDNHKSTYAAPAPPRRGPRKPDIDEDDEAADSFN